MNDFLAYDIGLNKTENDKIIDIGYENTITMKRKS